MAQVGTVRARHLRAQDNPAEMALWSVLKGRQLSGFKFTRKMPIGPYIADFVCRERNLVIEVDGSQHADTVVYDRARDEYMIRAGYAVFRATAGSVLNERDAVCNSILAVVEGRLEDFVEAFDLRFQRSSASPMRRGFSSRSSVRQQSG